jgi:gliding motility-associated-like protein
VSELLTPNQSGEESTWRIVNIDRYPSANVKVYSPSGLIVFESWNYQNDWNGTNKDGKTLPTGPYFYRIDRGNETTVEEGWLYIFN